jgi:hypothetical protein
MKNSVIALFVASLMVTLFSVQISLGQSCEKPSFPIKGKYKANCSHKILSFSSVQQCKICPFTISGDKKSISFPIFLMDFEEEKINITMNDVITTVAFTCGKKFSYLKFKFNQNNYKFKLYYGEGNVDFMLKDRTGNIITLKKMD